ncbi:MAG: glycosyl transferase family 1 [Thiomonas sp. 14-64-326]|jgi:glycosyltransferase involved in cell wall biosynthesis|uniref:glycosyltransferase family 4 protein n=1 Tax=Thiomonas sp. TaxID=2047785 RepID=UPI000BDC3869|nr:glycosyltransferase family 4 protein [Thiomonas sp.]OZB72743.1 MAG: glycosyl transferase family 1 [Thiomonas sp. 14-64-326]
MTQPFDHNRLHLAITAQALNHGGGAERYARDVLSGLLDLGISPLVIARKIDRSLPQAQRTRCLVAGTQGVPRPWRNAVFDRAVRRIIVREGIDCVFGVNQSLHAHIVVCGGTHPGFLRAMGKKPGWIDRRQIEHERRCFAQAKRIVAHSHRMRDELQAFYQTPSSKIDVLHPPVDTARFKPLDEQHRRSVRQRLGLPADSVVFLLASTGHARKGFAELHALFAQTSLPICLAVAGRPVPQRAPNIIELGYRTDIEAVFAAADYTVIASHYEPFGLVGVESVLCGTPVVIGQQVGSAEVIDSSAKIVVAPTDAADLAQAIAAACARALRGEHRIADPAKALLYDPSVQTHVRQLLGFFAACQTNSGNSPAYFALSSRSAGFGAAET